MVHPWLLSATLVGDHGWVGLRVAEAVGVRGGERVGDKLCPILLGDTAAHLILCQVPLIPS